MNWTATLDAEVTYRVAVFVVIAGLTNVYPEQIIRSEKHYIDKEKQRTRI